MLIVAGRLPAYLEAGGLMRAVNAAGGFATVLHHGSDEQGTILVLLTENGANPRLFERMPRADGDPEWTALTIDPAELLRNSGGYLERRTAQDPDLWVIELDIAQGERFILSDDRAD